MEWSKKLNEIDDVVDDDDDDDDNDFGDKIRFLDMNKYNFYFGCNGSNKGLSLINFDIRLIELAMKVLCYLIPIHLLTTAN